MKAEEFINNWLNHKYAGAKEIGDWTFSEIVSLLTDFQKAIWDEAQEVAFESGEDEETFSVELIEAEDLRNILDQPE